MSMSDIVSALNQPWLAEAGLICFLAAFALIVARLFRAGHRASDRAAALLPLEEAPLAADRPASKKGDNCARVA